MSYPISYNVEDEFVLAAFLPLGAESTDLKIQRGRSNSEEMSAGVPLVPTEGYICRLNTRQFLPGRVQVFQRK